MSESSIQDDGRYQYAGSPQACGYDTSLLGNCGEIVGLMAESNSPEGPYNSVEARHGSEDDFAVAQLQQAAIIVRLEYLAVQITDRAATSDAEIEGKIRALDALTAVASWERDSLRALRVSIERDRVEVIKALYLPLAACVRLGWLSRCFGLSPRLAD